MKVCMISGSYPPMRCGVGDYTARLCEAMSLHGADVSVITTAGGYAPRNSVEVYRTVTQWDRRAVAEIACALQQIQPDILNIQFPTTGYGRSWTINLLPALLHRAGISHPTVTTFHEYGINSRYAQLRQLASMATSNAVITTNEMDYGMLSRSWWMRRKPTAQIPIGTNIPVDPGARYSRNFWREKLGIAPNELLLSYFGNLHQNKQVHLVIETLSGLLARGYPAKLIIIANTSHLDRNAEEYYQSLLHRAKDLNISSQILWTGYIPESDVSANLLCSDLCLLPFADGVSFRRGTFMAALTHGIPVISTRGEEEPPDGVLDGSNMLLAPLSSIRESLLAHAERLAKDPDLRRAIGYGGQELAARFEWRNIGRDTLKFYDEVLSRCLGRRGQQPRATARV